MRRSALIGLAGACVLIAQGPVASGDAPRSSDLKLECDFPATTLGGEIACTLSVGGPETEASIMRSFKGLPVRQDAPTRGRDGNTFDHHFFFSPDSVGQHTLGPFEIRIGKSSMRSNAEVVECYAKPPETASIWIVPARRVAKVGEQLGIEIHTRGGSDRPWPKLRGTESYRLAGSYSIKHSSAQDKGNPRIWHSVFAYTILLERPGTLRLDAASLENTTSDDSIWTVPIEVVAP